MAFTLPKLNYSFDALEPHYDARTVEIHYSKHHATYVAKLNAAVESAGIGDKSLEDILTSLDSIAPDKRTPVRNHAGGVWNHTFFWESMTPDGTGTPKGDIAGAITNQFGSIESFQETFSTTGANHFGAGWT